MKIYIQLRRRASAVLLKLEAVTKTNLPAYAGHDSSDRKVPTRWQLIVACRPHTGLFACILTIVGFNILKCPLLPTIFFASAFCGVTLSIMTFNDLMDTDRDVKKSKTFALCHPWHMFKTWKWISIITLFILLITSVMWWKLALFCGVIWSLGLVYSVENPSYPFNNLLVAVCSASPALVGMIQAERWDSRILLLFFIISATILAMETVKDMQDKVADVGHKDTLATRVAWPVATMQAVLLCYLPIIGLLLYPNRSVAILGYVFGIIVFFLGLSFTREKELLKAEKVGDLFLAALLLLLLCTH